MLALTTSPTGRTSTSATPADGEPVEMFADRDYDPVAPTLTAIELAGYGYRWIRLLQAS